MAGVQQPWYRNGLRFRCTQCGNCCQGAPGYVWVSEDEIAALAERLGLDDATFRQRYTFPVKHRGVSLVERPHSNHACVFYDDQQGCTVYEDRPKQCRTWPFWQSNVDTVEDWDLVAKDCPGCNTGPRYDAATIQTIADDDGLAS